MYLVVGILFLMTGILNFFLENALSGIAGALFLLSAAFWFYAYSFHRSRGFIEFEPAAIKIHEPGFPGSRRYEVSEIASIEEQKHFYLIKMKNGKKRKVMYGSIAKEEKDAFKEAVNALSSML